MFFFQNELDSVKKVWNHHNIRPSRRGLAHGRPNVMMTLPEIYGTHSYLRPFAADVINNVANDEICTGRELIPCDIDIYHSSCEIMRENNLIPSGEWSETLELYRTLRDIIRAVIQ